MTSVFPDNRAYSSLLGAVTGRGGEATPVSANFIKVNA